MIRNGNETIYAISTPPGRSAIAVIRISGSDAASVPALFAARCPQPGQFLVTRLMQGKRVLDQVVVLFMKAPLSSTGEDVCEIHCHGSRAVMDAITGVLATTNGLRMANPGEFTQRGYMNGKLDLSGVEGLADLIDAETPVQLHQAWSQIDGTLRAPVIEWRAELVSISAQLEALIDFVDEDLPVLIEQGLRDSTNRLITAVARNLNDGGFGELVRDGVTVALIGPVNAGKSTVLNALSGRSAAIVSDEAGTTRDIVQIQIELQGLPVTILDTAGIRDTSLEVESEGIKRSIMAAVTADLVLVVLDGSDRGWHDECAKIDVIIDDAVKECGMIGSQRIYVLNKADRGTFKGKDVTTMGKLVISALDPDDIDNLTTLLARRLVPLNYADGSVIITRQRHRQAMQTAHDALYRALSHNFQLEPELAAEDYRVAAAALGRITGEIDVEELLESIFSAFCIGK